MFNVPALKEALDAEGLPFDIQEDGTLDPYPEPNAPTPAQQTRAEAIRDEHNPATLSTRQKASASYAASGVANTGRLKYFPYFVHLQDEMLAVMSDPALTEQQCFTRLKTALKQDKATNPDHQFAFNMFLRQSSRKNNANVTEAVLDGLLYPARRTFYDEYEAFYLQGLMAGLSVILRNGNGG